MYPSEFMDQLVYDLIARYEAEVLPSGLIYLELRMKGHGVLIIEETIKQMQMRVCYCLFDGEGNPVSEPEIWFYLDAASYWLPYKIHRHTAGHYVFADLDLESAELVLTDAKHQAALAVFADNWAEFLRAQGWLDEAIKCITRPRLWSKEEPPQPPTEEDLWDWIDEYGKCTARDGCWVEPTGVCEHGHKSWLVELGLIVGSNGQVDSSQQDDNLV